MSVYVLREVSKKRAKPLWFKQMTAIGPRTTARIDEAMKFDDRDEAAFHPVHRFTLTLFDVEEKPDAR